MPTMEEIGSILTKIALADQGFLALLQLAAGKAACNLSQEDLAKLAAWGKNVQALSTGSSEGDTCQ